MVDLNKLHVTMRFSTLIFFLVFSTRLTAQNYQPTWESLDARPVPPWFKDAKFGIFIHWGVYSVPGWSSKGQYAEWYQNGLETNDTARIKYHKAKFGDRSYYDLANDFKAELFDPAEWAKLFERSGAKYIVLTSKHHDGFALWPSKEASQTWGFKWNAAETGPHRDLLGDLFKAVRQTSVHAGMYYSLYEWFNPLWKSDRNRFVAQHTWPQMRDLIMSYEPDVFWTDGDWEASDETWRSKEFLAWLYNESPVRDKVVVNDRWGSGIRFKHAGIFTPEYQPDLDFEDHYWEESRGMGYSYGYNREEDAWDYNSAQSLVLQLIDKVSRGGNFLLDIGPDEHGKIPPIMEERLLQIGDWLQINGEAIYGTERWKESSQWGAGRRDYRDRSGDMLLKITVDPDPGYAVKEVFYTYNAKTNSLYAILPQYPADKKITLKNIVLPQSASVSLLTTQQKLKWTNNDGNTVVELPDYDPAKFNAPYAYVIKIAGYGNFTYKPVIKVHYEKSPLAPTITIERKPGVAIAYTLDGTEPTVQSPPYSQPFTLNRTATVKATAFQNDAGIAAIPSAVASVEAVKYEWLPAVKTSRLKPGLNYSYYEPEGKISMSSFASAYPKTSGNTSVITGKLKQRNDRFALLFEGYIKIDRDGIYTFYTSSDDGSILFIDEKVIVNNDGDHGIVEQAGKVALRKGFHKIRIQYFDSGGGNGLDVYMQPSNGKKQAIPPAALFH
jgi:alpha-L-fucosidase